jgi:hypothetical protein
MTEGVDPARTGVTAGRVVGLLTAAITVVALWHGRSSFAEATTVLLGLVGIDSGLPVAALFWSNAAVTVVARYTACYVVGSLVGVVYDYLDRPSLPVLVGVVLVVGVVDGLLAGIDTGSAVVTLAYVLAWLGYVPAFVWLFDADAADTSPGPVRFGDR